MYNLNDSSVFNAYYTRMFGIIFNELKDWVSLRCWRSGFLEIFRPFTSLATKEFMEGLSNFFII